ncbi:MAG: tetratricopeptide repeat protein [Gemmatimonadota bacterium]
MHLLKTLIHEIHRRSLWQVTGIFLAASWGVLQVVEVVSESVGLPDWTQGMAFVLLLLGLPVVLATAFVQEGLPGAPAPQGGPDKGVKGSVPEPKDEGGAVTVAAPASETSGVFTWRNALLGGLGAFTLLGISLVAYFVMWTTGIGPLGSLAAQGVFKEGEPVILAEFENSSNDPTLGGVVTEALRVDLASSQVITLLGSSRVDEVLGLMQRDPGGGLPPEIAREVAARAGVKAIIEGEVGSAGNGYILLATIRSADSGDALATFRRTARSADDVIEAIDGLSQDLREKAGESLRSIKAEAPLDQVTTSSLEALRKYSEAENVAERGDYVRAKQLLQEAVFLDPGFAMAWRKLSVVVQSAGGEPGEGEAAATKAYELRDRLTELERGNAIAFYHQVVTGDVRAWIAAYEGILAKYPDDPPSLNNLAIAYGQRSRWEEGLALLDRAVGGPGESGPSHVNTVAGLVALGRTDQARAALARMVELYPQRDTWNRYVSWLVESVAGDQERAHQVAAELSLASSVPAPWRAFALGVEMSTADAGRGRLAEAREHMTAAVESARSAGDPGWAVRIAINRAQIERIAGGRADAATGVMRKVIASGDFDALPAVARPWQEVGYELAMAGAYEEARATLDAWEREGGAAAGTALSEASIILDALSRPSPEASVAALEAFRTQAGCPRCLSWQLAELNARAGRPAQAAALYEEAMSYQFGADAEFILERVVGHERLGDLYAELGDATRAAEHYEAFADAWADADAELQPRVRRARARVEEVRKDG